MLRESGSLEREIKRPGSSPGFFEIEPRSSFQAKSGIAEFMLDPRPRRYRLYRPPSWSDDVFTALEALRLRRAKLTKSNRLHCCRCLDSPRNIMHVAEMERAYSGDCQGRYDSRWRCNTDPTHARFASEKTFRLLKGNIPLSERVTNPVGVIIQSPPRRVFTSWEPHRFTCNPVHIRGVQRPLSRPARS